MSSRIKKYSPEDLARIAELTVYPDRKRRRGGPRKPVPDGWEPVGIFFAGSARPIVYRSPDHDGLSSQLGTPGECRVALDHLIEAEMCPTFVSWGKMNARCGADPADASYAHYNGRVHVCPAWKVDRYGMPFETKMLKFTNYWMAVFEQRGRLMLPGDQANRINLVTRTVDVGNYEPGNVFFGSREEAAALHRSMVEQEDRESWQKIETAPSLE